ncbi:hypothetical protein [Palleronia caenipelagi]|uniref:Sulfotransferase domain-containing protein n=1 Tax=Palleronia caenipelagi TaxID=2489174 RepID=A0A547Q7U1_9RHOB|nr:hypothetical protein [Palleronia caenipelagi]TRD22433.1 hypothetical protein FEV53_05080 [Palleronia caenipelagi]
MPRLIIHIGSQKTGSTSIQTFLTQVEDKLAAKGINYVSAARGPAAHNKLAYKRDTDNFPRLMRRLVREVQGAPDQTHIISAEMLFSPRMASSLTEFLPADLREETRIVGYIRRQDKFLEAMYKQVSKTGRFRGTPADYRRKRQNALNYSATFDAYANGFGRENVVVLPYEPKSFPNKNVLFHVAPYLELGEIDPADLPEKFSNITLSREVSELLGVIANHTDIDIAELIRVIIRNESEGAFYSGDSYSPAEQREIVDHYVEDNEYIRATYRPDLDQLFDCSDLEGDLASAGVPAEEQVLRLRQAQLAVFQAIGDSHTSARKDT